MIINLYNQTVQIEFDDNNGKHTYSLITNNKKEKLISVSSIIGQLDKSQFLVPWAIKEMKNFLYGYIEHNTSNNYTKDELIPIIEQSSQIYINIKNKALTLGEQLHNFIEIFFKNKIENKETKLPEKKEEQTEEEYNKLINAIQAFLNFYNKNEIIPIEIEKILYSKKYNYVGRCDAILEINKKRFLVDYKTSKFLSQESFYQIEAYKQAYNEEKRYNGIKKTLKNSAILHINKETGEFNFIKTNKKDKNLQIFLNLLKIKNLLNNK